VREFLQHAFAHADLDWKQYVKHDDRYERPAEVDLLIGDPAKAKRQLDWEPKVRFQDIVKIMVDADLEQVRRDIEGSGTPKKTEDQSVISDQ
jgi:GDPmannose 4,6-dehydratase